MTETPVMIVGAGPSGLALALFLARQGVVPRIIDKNSGPGQASRAMVVHARTLEFYRQLGFAEEVVQAGIQVEALTVSEHGKEAAHIAVKDLGEGLSPYPFILSYPQDDHERLLVRHLQAAGIEVEWETELADLHDTGFAVEVTLRHKDGSEERCAFTYLGGSDGARSTVRHQLDIGFPGGDYQKTYFVADVEATGGTAGAPSLNLCFEKNDFLIVLPIRSAGRSRLIGIVPEAVQDRSDLDFEAVRAYSERAGNLKVTDIHWFSIYRSHHRVAEHFRKGRVFLLGDAGHIHSPVGGQGMNTGIGDAVNLAWKLAAVVQGRADGALLDTYEPERIAFAHSLVATTDKIFQLINSPGLGGQLFRETLLPHLAGFALGFHAVRTAAFRMVSQIRIQYRESALSSGESGDIHGGDRLPWTSLPDGGDNFTSLQSVDWQFHVYGTAKQELIDLAHNADLPLHVFGWTEAMEKAGLKQDAFYLVRPDGYVAATDAEQNVESLKSLLTNFKIRPHRDVHGAEAPR